MTKTFEEELDKLIKDSIVPSGKVEEYMERKNDFIKKYTPQPLQEVPEYIGKLINTFGAPKDGEYINYAASYPENKKELDWIDKHQKTWLTALLVGFTIEKPQMFYLKNKLTGLNLVLEQCFNIAGNRIGEQFREYNMQYVADEQEARRYKNTFTQAEIDSMQTGSYEQIEVTK